MEIWDSKECVVGLCCLIVFFCCKVVFWGCLMVFLKFVFVCECGFLFVVDWFFLVVIGGGSYWEVLWKILLMDWFWWICLIVLLRIVEIVRILILFRFFLLGSGIVFVMMIWFIGDLVSCFIVFLVKMLWVVVMWIFFVLSWCINLVVL